MRYSSDVLSPGWRKAGKPVSIPMPVAMDMVLEDAASGFCGAVVRWENGLVVLEDRHGRRRSFPFGTGLLYEGKPVDLSEPVMVRRSEKYTASGSLRGPDERPRVARASRIWVEGTHDAELVEKVWGDDLRHIGIVVEPLGGIDHVAERVAEFAPTNEARLGILVDHLMSGTKEDRIVSQVLRGPYREYVQVRGHEHVDVWQTVSPKALGVAAWPQIPKDQDWKKGVCMAFGWDHHTPADIARAWRRILARVHTWEDLDRPFVTEVERLIDFVQADETA